jgi:hypothetical protein
MIGLPEMLILLVIFLIFAGPLAVGIVIWKYVVKRDKVSAKHAADR